MVITVDFGDDVAHLAARLSQPVHAGDERETTLAPCPPPAVSAGAGGHPDVGVGRVAGTDDLVCDGTGVVNGDGKSRPRYFRCVPLLPGAEAMAELMPMTWPFPSTSGPPELPGLIAASVWMAPMSSPPAAAGLARAHRRYGRGR